MRHIIMADLEGAGGVERFSQTYADEPFKRASMRLLTREVNACIEGIHAADPQADIYVIDRHGGGGIVAEERDPRARYAPWGVARREIFPDYQGFDTYLYVGQHAMAGLANAPLCHTDSSKQVVYKRFNGIFVGEFGIEALRAGHHGVRVIFFAGDDKAVAEARALVPNIVTVTTKWGAGWQRARHLSSEESCTAIRTKAAEAVRQYEQIQPLRMDPPYAHEIRFVYPRECRHMKVEGVRMTQLDPYTVLFRFDDLNRLQVVDL
jgi:D-amino peptidase